MVKLLLKHFLNKEGTIMNKKLFIILVLFLIPFYCWGKGSLAGTHVIAAGWASGYSSQESADNEALKHCLNRINKNYEERCKVLLRYDKCLGILVLDMDDGRLFLWAEGNSKSEAEQNVRQKLKYTGKETLYLMCN